MPAGRTATLPPADEIAARVRGGRTCASIAREYGVTPEAVSCRLAREGYSGRTGELKPIEDVGTATTSAPAGDGDWRERGLCMQTDPEAFFPEKGGSTRQAKQVCLACEVRTECLEYALANEERFGIWGGLSERERRRLKRQRSGGA